MHDWVAYPACCYGVPLTIYVDCDTAPFHFFLIATKPPMFTILFISGPPAILQPGGGLPNNDQSIPRRKKLQIRLDSPNPSRRVLERPARPEKLRPGQILGPARIHIRRTQRPTRNRRFQHLHGGTLATRANPEARLGRVPPTQLGDIVQGPTQHPRRPLHRQTPPILHRVRPEILFSAVQLRRSGGGDFEPGPTQWGEVQAVHAGVSRQVRGQRDVIALQMVELDQLEERGASALRRSWRLGKRVGKNFRPSRRKKTR